MTAIERTEELVQNLFVAQNELIVHLGNLKGMPFLARVLFGPVEKNSTIEKTPTPEKNSSEVEKIRQTWMDDVVGLASEFFINEEAFNLENLTELLKSTVGAIADILALGPEENSVNQTKKKFTFREKLMDDHPECVNPRFAGGCEGCPFTYRYEEEPSEFCGDGGNINCEKCWDREYTGPETFRDKLREEHPDRVDDEYIGGCKFCPGDYWDVPYRCNHALCTWNNVDNNDDRERKCRFCWNQPYKPQV